MIAPVLLGIFGGAFGLLVGLFGYVLAGIAGAATGSPETAALIKLLMIAIPIASIIGGAIATATPKVAGIIMLLSAVGMLGLCLLWGFNFFTLIPLVLTSSGGILALTGATAQTPPSPAQS